MAFGFLLPSKADHWAGPSRKLRMGNSELNLAAIAGTKGAPSRDCLERSTGKRMRLKPIILHSTTGHAVRSQKRLSPNAILRAPGP